MSPVATADEAFEAIQRVKAGATAFCTNFFPDRKKIESWTEHGELFGETGEQSSFFFRKDRDLWHLYFCASDAAVLKQELGKVQVLKQERVVSDVVGNEAAVGNLKTALQAAGFRPYAQLQRMARVGANNPPVAQAEVPVVFAEKSDAKSVVDLLDASFDRNADQLPARYEIDAAIEARQILAVKSGGAVAALLFFETQGMTSTLRFWAVAEAFQSRRFGSALIRKYFEMHSAVRRFILWVVADNRNAVEKYGHYGYIADGLVDHVLANELIHG